MRLVLLLGSKAEEQLAAVERRILLPPQRCAAAAMSELTRACHRLGTLAERQHRAGGANTTQCHLPGGRYLFVRENSTTFGTVAAARNASSVSVLPMRVTKLSKLGCTHTSTAGEPLLALSHAVATIARLRACGRVSAGALCTCTKPSSALRLFCPRKSRGESFRLPCSTITVG